MQTRSQAARAQRLALRHPESDLAFTQVLQSIFRQWTALELAIFHQWGGDTSGELAAHLLEEVKEFFYSSDEKIYKDDMSLLLEDFLESNFSTICEDGSPDELGELICTVYNQCGIGNFDLANDIISKERMRSSMVSRSVGVEDQGDAMDSDDDDVEGDGEAALEEAVAEALEEVPRVDADGWETVSKRKKKNGK